MRALVLGLAALTLSSCATVGHPIPWTAQAQVTAGMDAAAVVKLLGAPIRIEVAKDAERWTWLRQSGGGWPFFPIFYWHTEKRELVLTFENGHVVAGPSLRAIP